MHWRSIEDEIVRIVKIEYGKLDGLYTRVAKLEAALKIYANHDDRWCAFSDGWVEGKVATKMRKVPKKH